MSRNWLYVFLFIRRSKKCKRSVICALMLMAVVPWAYTVTSPQSDKAIALFDGDTLSGWQAVGEAGWQVVGGLIEAKGAGDGLLVSATQYGNFRLTLEFWVDETINSGVFIGCPTPTEINPKACYEINIWDDHPNPHARTGAIVFQVMPPLAQVDTVGQWNTYEIVSVDSRVKVTLNGTLTAELANAHTAPGFIALQHAGNGTVRFRKLELQWLAAEQLSDQEPESRE